MSQTLAPYHDRPQQWIMEHRDQLKLLIDKYGDTCVLIALDNCLEAGKLDFFFQDFGRYKPAIREEEHGDSPRCPGCGKALNEDPDSHQFCCFICRKFYRPDLSEIAVDPVDTDAITSVLPWRRKAPQESPREVS